MKELDRYMLTFCAESLACLKRQDRRVADNMQHSKWAAFYSGDHMGLGLFGTCERDLQYIIFSELCRNFKLYPEYTGGYNNRQRVDLALWSDAAALYEQDYPDIAVEMKWARFTKGGHLSADTRQSLVNDVLKMKRGCTIAHRFFMQFAITDATLNLDHPGPREELEQKVNDTFYQNQFRNHHLSLNYFGSFETMGQGGRARQFNLLLWKLSKFE